MRPVPGPIVRPLLLDNLHEDHVELTHENLLVPVGVLRAGPCNDQIDDEALDPRTLPSNSAASFERGQTAAMQAPAQMAWVVPRAAGPECRGAAGRGSQGERRRACSAGRVFQRYLIADSRICAEVGGVTASAPESHELARARV